MMIFHSRKLGNCYHYLSFIVVKGFSNSGLVGLSLIAPSGSFLGAWSLCSRSHLINGLVLFSFLMKNHVPYLYKGCFLCMPMDVDFNWCFLLQDFTSRPDIADDCFLLASRCIRYCPHIFVLSSIFPSLVDCSMIGITIQHRYFLLFSIKI